MLCQGTATLSFAVSPTAMHDCRLLVSVEMGDTSSFTAAATGIAGLAYQLSQLRSRANHARPND